MSLPKLGRSPTATPEIVPTKTGSPLGTQRVVVAGSDDPDVDHFNDYVFIMEILESFPGTSIFDPHDESFVEK